MRGLVVLTHHWLQSLDASKPWHLLGLTLALLLLYTVLWVALLWLWNRCLADLTGRSLQRLAFDAGLVGVVLLALYLRSQTDAVLASLVVSSLVWRLTRPLRRARKTPVGRAAASGLCALLALVVLQAASLNLPNYRLDRPLDDRSASLRQPPGDLMVGMAISGGGSRAAYFASAFLRDIADLTVPPDPGTGLRARTAALPVPWLDELDAVVGVSGGSLAATRLTQILGEARRAAGAAPRGRDLPERIDDMHREMGTPFLWRGFLRRATKGLFLQPLFGYTMTEGLRDSFAAALFGNARLFDLPVRPLLSVLATDLATGLTVRQTQFGIFFEEGVGPLAPGTSLAEACVASSAVPGLLPGVELPVCHKYSPPSVCEDLRFHRLVDGGVVDNLGLTALQAAMLGLHAGRPCGFRGILYVVIDAAPLHVRREHCFDGAAVTGLRFSTAPETRGASRIDEIRDSFEILYRSAQAQVLCRSLGGFEPLEPGRQLAPRPQGGQPIEGMTYDGEAWRRIRCATAPAVALVNLQAAGYLLAERRSGKSRWFSDAFMARTEGEIARLRRRNEAFDAPDLQELARHLDRAASSIRTNFYLSPQEKEILDFIALIWSEFYRAPIARWFEQARRYPLPCPD